MTHLLGGGDDVEAVSIQTHDRHVALVGAAGIEQAGVHDATDGDIEAIAAKPVEAGQCVGPLNLILGKCGLVEQRDLLSAPSHLGRHMRCPVLFAEGVTKLWLGARGRIPQWAFPACGLPKAGAGGAGQRVQWCGADIPRCLHFAIGPSHLVVQAQHFRGTGLQISPSILRRHKAADIHTPEVHGHLARLQPRHGELADTAGTGDADRVEPSEHEQPLGPSRSAHQEIVVGREALRTVDELRKLRRAQRRDAVFPGRPGLGKLIPVVGQQAKGKVTRDGVSDLPGL